VTGGFRELGGLRRQVEFNIPQPLLQVARTSFQRPLETRNLDSMIEMQRI
jgi:hypothetical protein